MSIDLKIGVFEQSLDFKKVKLDNSPYNLRRHNVNSPLNDVPYVYNNIIRTVGHTVGLFGSKLFSKKSLPNLTATDLKYESWKPFEVYGVDPSHRHLITAVDTEDLVLRFPNNEWYTKSGFVKRQYIQQNLKKDHNIVDLESNIPSLKTSNLMSFAASCQYLVNVMPALMSFYGCYYTNDRFLSYIGNQKVANELVNIFVSGGIKYDHQSNNSEKLPLLLLDSKGTNSVSGKKQSLASKAIKALKRAEREGMLLVCEVDENYTSKVCHECQTQSMVRKEVEDSFGGDNISLWGVLNFRNCGRNWGRDVNAASNILHLGLLEAMDMKRPAVFSRRIEDDSSDNASDMEE